jgi:hypothetical protein
MRPVATSEFRQMRLIHQTDKAIMLSASEELIISIKVVVVFVREIVLAVIGSHLIIYFVLEINGVRKNDIRKYPQCY